MNNELQDFFKECTGALEDALYGLDPERIRKSSAIRDLITDYPKLKAKYDALRGKVEEWKERSCRCFSNKTIPALEQADVFHKGLAREFIRDIRDFKEEQDAKL